MSNAPAISDFELSEFGPSSKPGVYAVCVRYLGIGRTQGAEHVLYIGSSSNVYKRVMNPNHPYMRMCNRFRWPFVVYTRSLYTPDYVEVEKRAIRAIQPWFNITHKYGKAIH